MGAAHTGTEPTTDTSFCPLKPYRRRRETTEDLGGRKREQETKITYMDSTFIIFSFLVLGISGSRPQMPRFTFKNLWTIY